MIMTFQPVGSCGGATHSNKDLKHVGENDSGHNMFCLNIFERAVQDPCSKDCDTEDDNLLLDEKDRVEDPDPLDESFEDDYTMSPKTFMSADGASHCCSRHCRLGKPQHTGKEDMVQSTSMAVSPYNNLIHQQSSPVPLTTARPCRSRTNSSILIRQISRQSFIDNNNNNNNSNSNNNNNNNAFYHSHNNSHNNIDNLSGCGSSSSPTSNDDNSRRSSVVQRSRSSCSGIPTHLYGLEKYVSSALDALSTGDYNSTISSPQSSSTSPSFAPYSSPQSDSSLNSIAFPLPPPSLPSKLQSAKRTRKKSFIEMSLANSFSP